MINQTNTIWNTENDNIQDLLNASPDEARPSCHQTGDLGMNTSPPGC